MMLQLVTDAVISKGYGGAPAFHSSEDGRMLSFKIGCKVYDKRADKETRWVNFNVNAFDDLAERVRRMNLKEGSHINVMGNFDMKPWVNRARSPHGRPSEPSTSSTPQARFPSRTRRRHKRQFPFTINRSSPHCRRNSFPVLRGMSRLAAATRITLTRPDRP